MTKRLKSYINQLPFIGMVGILSGIFFFYILLTGKSEWDLFGLIFKIFGASLAYFLCNHFVPGGNVNFYFVAHKKNEDENKLNELIVKYRNKTLITIIAISYILVDTIVGFSRYEVIFRISFEGLVFYPIASFGIVNAMCQGVKLLSAWWNIRRNLKI